MVSKSRGQQAKKLTGAVDYLFNHGGANNDDILKDAEVLGIELPDDLLKERNYEVWKEHENVVLTFLRVQTQWRTGPNGYIGLDYGVVFQVCKLYKIKDMKTLFEDLQIMEMRALELIAKEQKKANQKAEMQNRRSR